MDLAVFPLALWPAPISLPSDALGWLAVVWLFALGGCIGSFLNVVVYRWPRGMSLARPGSHCPRCGHPIRWHDNIPILSWLVLRTRCRDCGGAISARYPLVEATVAIAFGLLAATGLAAQSGPMLDATTGEAIFPPAAAWAGYVHDVVLFCLLLVLVLVEYDGRLERRQRWILALGGLAFALLLGLIRPAVQPGWDLLIVAANLANDVVEVQAFLARVTMLVAALTGALIGAVLGWLAEKRDIVTFFRGGLGKNFADHVFCSGGVCCGWLVGGYLGWKAVCLLAIGQGALLLIAAAAGYFWSKANESLIGAASWSMVGLPLVVVALIDRDGLGLNQWRPIFSQYAMLALPLAALAAAVGRLHNRGGCRVKSTP